MNELIKIETNENLEPIISGRELHEKLGIETPFKKWIISEVLSKFRTYENDETYEKKQLYGLISNYYNHYVEYLKKSIDEKNKLINETYEIVKKIKDTHNRKIGKQCKEDVIYQK